MAALSGYLNNIFGRYTASKPFPLENIVKNLEALCTLPPHNQRSGKRPKIPDSRFLQIAHALKQYEDHQRLSGLASRPRIYTLLTWVNKTDLIKLFILKGLTDYDLPINYQSLPEELEDARERFIDLQNIVLTDTKGLELGEKGSHVSLEDARSCFHFQVLLGSGASGDVHAVLSRLSLRRYALKRFRRQGNQREAQEWARQFRREMQALKRVRHEHLVQIMGSYTDRMFYGILMEPVADCNLQNYLLSISPADIPSLRSFFGCLAGTLAYLHSMRIHHMDLKLENILVWNGAIFVADFGSSHDWAKAERSTTWQNVPKTARYMPPELARDTHAPRNSATDIWSLGVVFLEMASVLRGFSVAKFRTYLTQNGSYHSFVFGNPVAGARWIEKLRQEGSGPDFDNDPLIWIHDMLRSRPVERPAACTLFRSILQSSSGEKFRRACCSDPEQYNQIPIENQYEEINTPDVDIEIEFEEDWVSLLRQDANQPIQSSEKSQSIQAWIDFSSDPLGSSVNPKDNLQGPSEHFEQEEELPYLVEDDDDTASVESMLTCLPPLPTSNFDNLWDPDFWKSCGSDVSYREGFSSFEAETEDMHLYEIVLDDSGSDQSDTTIRQCDFHKNPIDEEMGVESLAECCSISPEGQSDPEKAVGDSKSSIEVKEEGAGLGTRSTSQTKPMLSGDPTTKPQVSGKHPNTNPIQSAGTSLPLSLNMPIDSVKRDADSTNVRDQDEIVVPVPSNIAGGVPRGLSGTSRSGAKESNLFSSKEVLQESPPKRALTAENLETYDALNKEEPASKDQEKGEEPKRKQTQPRKKLGKRRQSLGPLLSADEYLAQYWQAETSKATSIMSQNTAKRFSTSFGLLKWQDKTEDLLSIWCRKGNAQAVRKALESGCNPGTRENRRANPIIFAAKGGTEGHVKCIRSLLEHGADMDVKSKKTGKTPIHFAVEAPYFKGHTKAIIELLINGASPNIADYSGEYPLLKLLYGSYEPLEKHRRDALAWLLKCGAAVDSASSGTLNKPLHLAVRRKDTWAVGMLLEKGAVVDEPNGAGDTPLALAINAWDKTMTEEQKKVAWQLLNRKATVGQSIGTAGNTALHTAIKHGIVDVVEELLGEYSASPKQLNKLGENPLLTACVAWRSKKIPQETYDRIVVLLLDALDVRVILESGVCPFVTARRNPASEDMTTLLGLGSGSEEHGRCS